MAKLSVKVLLVSVPALTIGALALLGACSSSSGGNPATDNDSGSDGTTTPDHNTTVPDGSLTKPPPKPKDGGSDAKPPPPPPGNKDGGHFDSGKVSDADIPDTSTGGNDSGTTIPATPLDPIDESLMPDYGVDVGTCADLSLADSTGLCKSNASGQDFVEGCVTPDVYVLDCARYETPGSVRSICVDDGVSNVGCNVIDVKVVDDFEKGQSQSAYDLFHACPSSWEGYGNCQGDFVRMCIGGEDYALDCTIYNGGGFTYTCRTNSLGKITCL